MNTNHIRQQAISVALGELFAGTCEYTPNDEGAYGTLIEPDSEQLDHFRVVHLSELASLHQQGKLTVERVEFAQRFVTNVGWQVGHMISSTIWAGTWGVRMMELQAIQRVLTDIPANTELIRCKQCFRMFRNTIYRVQEYGSIRSTWMGVKVSTPDYPEQLPFSFTINWSELPALYCYNAVEGI